MTTKIRFWLDPACPWCWVTSRWVVDVAADRDLDVTWEPISLLFKNDTQPGSPWYEPVAWTRNLLRVMEAVRAKEGDAPRRPSSLHAAAQAAASPAPPPALAPLPAQKSPPAAPRPVIQKRTRRRLSFWEWLFGARPRRK